MKNDEEEVWIPRDLENMEENDMYKGVNDQLYIVVVWYFGKHGER